MDYLCKAGTKRIFIYPRTDYRLHAPALYVCRIELQS
ncbi:hypothetical protein SNE40_008735 [Patella caerulea]|uniref:Uncharacterized protein n=1 Tax=Patella caerulea TaxID=87958 RepID=A0AAN8JTP0_PATCE